MKLSLVIQVAKQRDDFPIFVFVSFLFHQDEDMHFILDVNCVAELYTKKSYCIFFRLYQLYT